MKQFIIQISIKIENVWKVMYHKELTLSRNHLTTNTYTEHITPEKEDALTFTDKIEADKMALFCSKDGLQINHVTPLN